MNELPNAPWWFSGLVSVILTLSAAFVAWRRSGDRRAYYEYRLRSCAACKTAHADDPEPPASDGPAVVMLLAASAGLCLMISGAPSRVARVLTPDPIVGYIEARAADAPEPKRPGPAQRSCNPPCSSKEKCQDGTCVSTARKPPQKPHLMADLVVPGWQDWSILAFPDRHPGTL